MQDSEIRKVLHSYLKKSNNKLKDTIIIDELDLCSGLTRIDIAVINGSIHGYEIKSEEDTLYRLTNQMNYYNKTLEKITIATNELHLEDIKKIVPDWWGILIIKKSNKRNSIIEYKKANENPLLEGLRILELLWKEELLNICFKFLIPFKKGDTKKNLRKSISISLELDQIVYEVRLALKSRKNWRN